MRLAKLAVLALLVVFSFHEHAHADVDGGPWNVGLREAGQGFYLSSPDQNFQLNFLGYGQFLAGVYSTDYQGNANRSDYPAGFNVRRARLAMLATLHHNFELMVEFGTPTIRPVLGNAIPVGASSGSAPSGTPSAPTAPAAHDFSQRLVSDFGLTEARISIRVADDAFQVRFGKFIGPFSNEGARNPRSLDVIERMSIINSMYTLPGLDTQLGVMIFGRLWDNIFNWYLAGFNGNSDSIGTPIDENGEKELQAKIVFAPNDHFHFGFGFDMEKTNKARLFSVLDHAFVPYVSGGVIGWRYGLEADISGEWDWFSFSGEGISYTFPDSTQTNFLRWLHGAHLNLGWMLTGDKTYGFQLITRGEWTRSTIDLTRDLFSAIAGFNVFINANVRNQINYICEVPSGPAVNTGVYATNRIQHILYEELQIKF